MIKCIACGRVFEDGYMYDRHTCYSFPPIERLPLDLLVEVLDGRITEGDAWKEVRRYELYSA